MILLSTDFGSFASSSTRSVTGFSIRAMLSPLV